MARRKKNVVQRTFRVRLRPTEAQEAQLLETRQQYGVALGYCVPIAWELEDKTATELHHTCYYDLRETTDLPAQLVCTAQRKAVAMIRSALALHRDECPDVRNPTVRFDARVFRFNWDDQTINLTLVGGRITLPFQMNHYFERFRGLGVVAADLVYSRGVWWLHCVTDSPKPTFTSNGQTVGVDRGVNKPAVTSDGRYYGERRWRAIEERKLALRRRLQSKGTRSAKRHLKRLSRNLERFRRDCDQVLAKQLVASVSVGATLVFEDLTHIRSRVKQRKRSRAQRANRRRLHSWSFFRLGFFVEYKAALKGIKVVYIDPRYTSQRCPACGYTSRQNRKDQAHFSCKQCGFNRNADLVGAWNIRDQHQGLWSPETIVRGPVNGPIVTSVGQISTSVASPGL